jgi:NAD(P)-dependent dehydrogenase (short-subunit alcohol dehydrogenase family)
MTWSIAEKTVLITGGNVGIGLETAVALARAGAHVAITSRDRARGEAALAQLRERTGSERVELLDLDLARFASIEQCAQRFAAAHDRLHVLINNAGLVLGDRRETAEGFEMTFGVNHLGPFYLTELMRPLLVAGAPARVINLSSHAHRGSRGLRFDDLQRTRSYAGFPAYCDSKLANIYFTRELARRLAGDGITAYAVHPGVVASGFGADGDMGGVMSLAFKLARPFLLSPEKGARTSVFLATSPEVADPSGGYFAKCRPSTPAQVAQDDAAAARLWAVSEELVAQARFGARPAQPQR